MPYARIDDRYDDHPKVKKALRVEPVAVAIHVMAITYCNRHVTDGVLERDWIDEKLALMPLRQRRRSVVIQTLLDTGLLEPFDAEHYLVHDFLDWNLSKQQRENLALQGKKGGSAKGKNPPPDGGTPSQGFSEGSSLGGNGSSSTPTPTPTPTPLHEEEKTANAVSRRQIQSDREERLATSDDLESCRLFFELGRERNPKMKVPKAGSTERTAALREMRLLRSSDGNSPQEIQRAIRWVFTDSGEDARFWGTTIQAPSGLREHFSQLWSKLTDAESNVVRMRDQRRPSAGDMLRALDEADAADRATAEMLGGVA